jgi:hypothetical protein
MAAMLSDQLMIWDSDRSCTRIMHYESLTYDVLPGQCELDVWLLIYA